MDSLIERLGQVWRTILNVASSFSFKDVIDIVVIGVLIYSCFQLVRETRAGQLIKGLLLLMFVYLLASQFHMVMLKSLLSQFVTFSVLALLILFQPEIRKVLEQVGRNNMGRTISGFFLEHKTTDEDAMTDVIENVVETAAMLQQMRMGALIVFERRTRLDEVVSTGTKIHADVTAQLLGNIFFNKAPLHDGAVIIREGRILAAGCILPLTARANVHANLGTRHRAALGISEDADAIALVVSEETGQISIAQNGVLTRNYNRRTLKETLERMLLTVPADEKDGGKNIWRKFSRSSRKERSDQDEE